MSFDPDRFRKKSLQTWGNVAAGWEQRRARFMEVTAPVNEWLLEKAGLESGQTVLEIGAGTGDLGFAAARRIAPDGRLISTDFSPEMVEIARRVGAAEGLSNVDYRIMDAENMALEDASVDVILCRWAFMLMANPAAAFAESKRVLRPDARLVFAVWTPLDRNPWPMLAVDALLERGHISPPNPEFPGVFSLSDSQHLIDQLVSAGFAEPELEEIAFNYVHPDFDDAWDMIRKLAGPIARVLDGLSVQELQAIRDAVEAAAAPYRHDDGSYAIPASTWAVVS